jgi:hypothetical protein
MSTPVDAAVTPATGTGLVPGPPCFVVMPFGTKPFNDGSGRTFDFDKVYRVIIERAVREAGLEPRRADQEKSSSIIHIDMFKSLRDNPIVLADLSLENPNVFYELGVRHVMSSRGTVLMCGEGSMLPFDVRLSRVIFYTYDGVSFDWEEVEDRVVPALRAILVEARMGRPDSPVHALLERVMPELAAERAEGDGDGPARRESLDPYQELVAAHWAAKKTPLAELKRAHAASAFGCRALVYLCLRRRTLNAGEARALTKDLYDAEQYDLTIRLFQRLEKQGVAFGSWELLRYGSSLFEVEPTTAGARKALAYELRAWDEARTALAAEGPTAQNVAHAFHCRKKMSMLYLSLWTLNRSDDDLALAIAAAGEALDYGRSGSEQGVVIAENHMADTHLRVMLMRRVQAADRDRPDAEGHGEAVLRFRVASAPKVGVAVRMNASYLRWYQAIVLADRGDGPRSFELALANAQDDASLRDMPGCHRIGGRQYTNLRHFIEQFAHTLRHVDLVARISQVLHRFQQATY